MQHLLRQLRKHQSIIYGGVVVLIFLGAALFGPAMAKYDPYKPNLIDSLQTPSATYPLGTDELGRDILTRLLHGARLSLAISVISTMTAAVMGTLIGMLAGFYDGSASRMTMQVMDGLIAFPRILIAIVLIAVMGPSISSLILAIGVSAIPIFARVARSSTLVVRELDFVEAARSLGAGDWRILRKHVLPQTLSPLIVQSSLAMAAAIATASGLSFLGLGPPPPAPEWGAMVESGRQYLRSEPHVILAPGLAIMLVVMGFNLLGDGIRDLLDPRLRR